MGQEDLKQWANQEAGRIEQERKEYMKEKGYEDFYKLVKGENMIELDTSAVPRDWEGEFGLQKIFRIKVAGKPYDLPVKQTSPVYRMIVKALSENKTKLKILRSGEGPKTTYELLDAA